MTQLSMRVPSPCIHFTKSTLGDNVSETTFDRIDSLTGSFKAANDFWNIIRINVTKAELSILIVFA